jgi:hypothetical protein
VGCDRPTGIPTSATTAELFVREHPGGVEVEMAFLFADVRGGFTRATGFGCDRRFIGLCDQNGALDPGCVHDGDEVRNHSTLCSRVPVRARLDRVVTVGSSG